MSSCVQTTAPPEALTGLLHGRAALGCAREQLVLGCFPGA